MSEASTRNIHWGCTRCKDDGVISNWRGSRWDLDAEALDSLPAWPGLVMDHQSHAELLDSLSVDHPIYAPLARAIHHPDGVVVLATEADLERMRGLIGGIAEPDLPKEASAMELIVLGTGTTNARCRILGGEELLTLRSGSACSLVPGEIVTLQPRKDWTYRRNRYVSRELDELHSAVGGARVGGIA